MAELWFGLKEIPDLTLNKYASLEENGVDGVLEKHIAFLRQLNRKGIVSGLSFHLFYFYIVPEDKSKDLPGHRLHIYLMVRGAEEESNILSIIKASPLSDFYNLETIPGLKNELGDMNTILEKNGLESPGFDTCAQLVKSETLLPARSGEGDDYYMIREWEMNDSGRLYNMCKMMEAINHTALYRVDLYPVERSQALRDALRKPISILRNRQDERNNIAGKDYEGKDVLKSYEDIIEKFDSEPHFVSNIMVFANGKEDTVSILDAAGSESLMKGKYNIATFFPAGRKFTPVSFLDDEFNELNNIKEKMILRKAKRGLIICRDDKAEINLNYLPTLFSLEEITPFFRLPALFDGETIQIAKETAPRAVSKEGSLYLGKDSNGYEVFFPLSLLPKHAFISGVPGSGKTNTMHHITSSLWKDHKIPFLVLEPAKQEYRALANDPGMKDMYLFSPNADMSFPLHINPFEMPKGTLVAEHIRRLCSVFEGAFPLEPPMPFLLDTAIEAVYRDLGWIPDHVYMGDETEDDGVTKRTLPSMSMLYHKLEEELKSTQYSEEVRGNLESALKVRIGSLLRREMGDVFDVPRSTFEPEKWLEVPAVIELESMGTGPANFLTLMLCALIRETLKVNPRFDGSVRHVIFIEEAHNLIGPESEEQTGAEADPKIAATAFVVKMLAEVRALKEGIVIADQLPTVMAQEVLKNTGLKLGLRITSADDRSLLGSTMAASSLQLEQMSTFAVGESLIFYEKLMRPFTLRIKEWCGEMEDAQKEETVTPKADADLREFLSGNEKYIDENLTSIQIIMSKYRLKMENLIREVNDISAMFTIHTDTINKMTKQDSMLWDIFSSRELNAKDQQEYEKRLDAIRRLTKFFRSHKAFYGNALNVYVSLCEMVMDLERLKTGRWKRFGLDEEHNREIMHLQNEMCSYANQISNVVDAFFNAAGNIVKWKIENDGDELLDSIKKAGSKEIIHGMIKEQDKLSVIGFKVM